jgi:hypothetical protein
MAYGQKVYNEIQGISGRYRINQIGCFLTAFCNLEERLGRSIDPLSLNAVFRDRGIYIDVDDGVRDDLGWGSITAYDPHVIATQTGAGWPNSNNAIVKFHYRSIQTGQMIDHFCLVADHNAKTIVDSWDGQVKSPGVYGEPVAYAVYGDNTPQAVAPVTTVNPDGKRLFLPSTTGTWRVYNLGGPWSVGHEIGKLATGANPPGLTYDILGVIGTNIYKIHTQTWGDVAIYAGPDTVAKFVEQPAPTPAPATLPIAEPPLPQLTNNVPPPSPTPAVEEPKGEIIPVLVKPDGFKDSFSTEHAGKYRAVRDSVIKDLNNEEDQRLPDAQLTEGKVYDIAGWFDKGGIHYAVTVNSVSAKSWHGIHEDLLEPEEDKDLFDKNLADEARIALGNLTRVERFKRFFRNIKDFLLRRIGRMDAKQNNKQGV